MAKEQEKMRIYEGMFLVEPSRGRRAEEETIADITAIIEKHGGKVINGAKWADRDLAYPIYKQHHKYTRAVYFLFHFSAPPGAVNAIDREVQISSWLIRALIIRDEDGTEIPGQEPEPALAENEEGEA